MHTPPVPLVESLLENFVVFLSARIGYKSIKTYLAGVQYWSKLQGCNILIKFMHRLKYVLSGIRRTQGKDFEKGTRPAITWDMLQRICAFIAHTELPHDRDMLTSAVLLAFFGLLRVSEYTCPSPIEYDEEAHLSVQDVAVLWHRSHATVNIKMSKTDPFRDGVKIKLTVLGHYLCPVHALARYLMRRVDTPGPLFIFQNGAYLTRSRVVDLLQRALPHIPNINTHSFRRGGATALASAGTPAHIIQIMGRWKSNAFAKYIEIPDEFIADAHKSMVKLKKKKWAKHKVNQGGH